MSPTCSERRAVKPREAVGVKIVGVANEGFADNSVPGRADLGVLGRCVGSRYADCRLIACAEKDRLLQITRCFSVKQLKEPEGDSARLRASSSGAAHCLEVLRLSPPVSKADSYRSCLYPN